MIVHGSNLSPFVRKVLVFAAEKGVAIESVPTGIGPKSDAFLLMSPFGKIPAFEDGDYKLCDSSAIVHYIEAKHPEPALIPAEARARGRTVWFDEYADTILVAALGPIFFNRVVAKLAGLPADLAAADKAQAEAVPKALDYLEGTIPASGFLVEDRLTLADIAVCCPLINGTLAGCPIDPVKYPQTLAYFEGISARQSFAALIDSAKVFLKI